MVNLVDDARLAVRLARNSLPADDGKRAGRIRSPTNVASKSLTSGRPAFRGAALETAMMDSIGHDLRGSLTVILGTVTTLLEYRSSLDEAVQGDLLEAIKEEVVRLNRYVAEILDQRRRCGDSRAAHIEATDIKGLALGVTQSVARAARTRIIEFDAPCVVGVAPADRVLLAQALTNVLENAVGYAREGSPIRVRVHEHHDCVSISVDDDGCGITPGHLEAVFQRRRRLENGVVRPEGAGLGLAIAKGFVESMGGSIHAVSPIREGRGTRVLISLPKGAPSRAA